MVYRSYVCCISNGRKQILFIGVPATITNIITPISMGVITRIISVFGTAAIAGFGVATRLEMIVLMIIQSLGGVMIPFTGQNWGSGNYNRVSEALIKSFKFSLIWSIIAYQAFILQEPLWRVFLIKIRLS